jgi:hypothetical protein
LPGVDTRFAGCEKFLKTLKIPFFEIPEIPLFLEIHENSKKFVKTPKNS